MKTPVIAGNWKMHKTLREALAFAEDLKRIASGLRDRVLVIAPPFPFLHPLAASFAGTGILLAGQNVHDHNQGAFTGEVSAPMLIDAGCTHVLVGHSERRSLFGESDALIQRKIRTSLQFGLRPILCIGETLAEREAGETFNVIERQLREALNNRSVDDMQRIVVAYEPVWAIGTGKTATAQQAQEVHRQIRRLLRGACSAATAAETSILYGGSVNPENVAGLMAEEDVDGVLVGGASLRIETFEKILYF